MTEQDRTEQDLARVGSRGIVRLTRTKGDDGAMAVAGDRDAARGRGLAAEGAGDSGRATDSPTTTRVSSPTRFLKPITRESAIGDVDSIEQ